MLNSIISQNLDMGAFMICIGSAMLLGLLTALLFSVNSHQSGFMLLCLSLIPPVVAIIIMLVSGNIGRGIAVAGTFSLVRFRSLPGNAKEITGIFFAVALGLCCGSGHVLMAGVFFLMMAAFMLILERLKIGANSPCQRQLRVTIPEDLDYDGLLDDLFEEYTLSHELIRVRTTNMGTLYELTYSVRLRSKDIDKSFIDKIRCRNGNLTVSCGRETHTEIL